MFTLEKKGEEFHMTASAAQFLKRLEEQIEKDYKTACETKETTTKRLAFRILYRFTVNMECLNIDNLLGDADRVKSALLSLEDRVFELLETGT